MRNSIPGSINRQTQGSLQPKINPFNLIPHIQHSTLTLTNTKQSQPMYPTTSQWNPLNNAMYNSTIQTSNLDKYLSKLQTMGRFIPTTNDNTSHKFDRNQKPCNPKYEKNMMFSSSILMQNSNHEEINRFPAFDLGVSKEKYNDNQRLNAPIVIEKNINKQSVQEKRKREIQTIKRELEQVTKKIQSVKMKSKLKTSENFQNNQEYIPIIHHSHTSHQIRIIPSHKITQSITSRPFLNSQKTLFSKYVQQKNQKEFNEWGRKSGKLCNGMIQVKATMFQEKDQFYIGKQKKQNDENKNTSKNNSSANYFDSFLVGQEIQIKGSNFQAIQDQKKYSKSNLITQRPLYGDLLKKNSGLEEISNTLTSSSSSTSSESSTVSENHKIIVGLNEKTFMKKKNPFFTQNEPENKNNDNFDRKNKQINFLSQNFRPSFQFKGGVQKEKKSFKKSDFEIGKKMGKGQFGQVMLVRHKKTGFICGMKVMSKKQIRDQKYENQISRELSIQFYLTHRNIAPLYGYFADEENVYLLVQFCTDGQLLQKLRKDRRMSEQDTCPIIKQICQGADYIHRQLIIHRDIKPENILFSFGVVKICDFGWAVYRGQGLRKTASGSPLYYSPQIVLGNEYDQKIDIWDIGMMTYECLLGKVPFRIYSQMDLKRIVTDQVVFPQYVDVSQQAKDFILKTLQKVPEQRMEIREMLRHKFITNQKEQKVSQKVMEEILSVMK